MHSSTTHSGNTVYCVAAMISHVAVRKGKRIKIHQMLVRLTCLVKFYSVVKSHLKFLMVGLTDFFYIIKIDVSFNGINLPV